MKNTATHSSSSPEDCLLLLFLYEGKDDLSRNKTGNSNRCIQSYPWTIMVMKPRHDCIYELKKISVSSQEFFLYIANSNEEPLRFD